MKKLIYLTLLLFAGFCASAQQPHEQLIGGSKDNNVARRGLRSDSTFGLPVIDTAYHPWRSGYITNAHGALYWWDGFRWRKLTDSASAAGVAGVTSFNTRTGVVVSDSNDYAAFYAPWNAGVTYNGKHVLLGGSATLILASADFSGQGINTQVLIGNASGPPAWGSVNINTMTTGTLLVNRGGTGTTTPSLVAGSFTTVSGSFPAQAINVDTFNFPKNINIGNGYRLVNTGPFGGQSNQIKTLACAGCSIDSTTSGVLTITATPGGTNGFMAARDTIAQVAHGFSVGKVVAFNGASWVLADTLVNFALGVVSIVIDADHFEVTHSGKMRWTAHGKILGVPYYVTSSGNVSNVAPEITFPVIWFISPDIAIVKMERGVEDATGAPITGPGLAGFVGAFSFFNTSTTLGSSNLYNDTIKLRLNARQLDVFGYNLSQDPLALNDSVRVIINTRHGSLKLGDNINGVYYEKDSLPYFSYDLGYNTYLASTTHYNFQAGVTDSIWGNKSINLGQGNKVGDKNNYARTNMVAIGTLNTQTADSTYSFGSANNLTTQGVAIGFRNRVQGSKSVVIGSDNWADGAGQFINGSADTASSGATNATVLGNQSRAGGVGAIAAGTGDNAKYNYQTVIGKWNDTAATRANMALEIGWGQNNNTRLNVFSVDSLGGALFNPGTTANRPANPAAGYLRYNSDTSGFEYYNTAWHSFGTGSGGGAVTIYNGDGTLNGVRTITNAGLSITLTTTTSDLTNMVAASNWVSQNSNSGSVGNILNGSFRINQTGANTGNTEALLGYAKASNATGSVVTATGVEGIVEMSGAGTLASGRGITGGITSRNAGAITNAIGLYTNGAQVLGTGTITNAYGLYIDASSAGSGTITNNYALWQQSTTAKNVFNGLVLVPNLSHLTQDTTNYKLVVQRASDGLLMAGAWQDVTVTANNGLTKTGSNIVLGGSLTGNTVISGLASSNLTINGGTNNANGLVYINDTLSSGANTALKVQSIGGTGISVLSGSGTAGSFSSTTGNGIIVSANGAGAAIGVFATGGGNIGGVFNSAGNWAAQFSGDRASTNTAVPLMNITRTTAGTATAGIGTSLEISLENGSGTVVQSNLIQSELTSVTAGSETSKLTLLGRSLGSTSALFSLSGNGALQLNKYGLGTFTGTPAYNLQVDASGNVIETSAGVGGVSGINVYNTDSTLAANRTITTGGRSLYLTTAAIDTAGLPPAKNFVVQYSGSTTTDQVVNTSFVTNQTAANTVGTIQGIQNVVKVSNGSGSNLNAEGISSTMTMSGAATATSMRSFQSGIINSNGTITTSIGFYDPGAVVTGSGVIGTHYGIRLGASIPGSGTITNRWGISQEDAVAKNRFDGKVILNNVFTTTGTQKVLVHETDSTIAQMALPALASGSFTPTLTNTTNISASSLSQAVYSQIGNIVTATVSGTLTSTDGTNVCILTLDLPVATSTTFQDGIGPGTVTLWIGSHGGLIGYISARAIVSNGTHFQLECIPTTTTISDFTITIQYHTN